MTLIIDADMILYQALSNAEIETEFEDDMWMLTCDHKQARIQFDDRIEQLIKEADVTEYVLCFSHPENFRKDIYPEYKANRKATRKPLGFKDFRAEMIDSYNSVSMHRIEADDVVGILATKEPDTIIYSEDKDLMQIPGKHLIDGEIVYVDALDGERFHMMQTLTGDQVDGYPGCPGVGPVKAKRLLDEIDPLHWWDSIVEEYEKKGLTEADALVQARVARILQHCDWDYDLQEPILWSPTK